VDFRWHSIIALLVILIMLYIGVARSDAIVIILVITFVLTLEIVNTVVERLVDMLKPRLHTYAESIKDLTAALVLIGSLAAVIIGILVFYPYILR
jgi:undecaprenol kinase